MSITTSITLTEAIERAYDAVWSTLSAHVSSDRHQSHELKIVLSQTLVALAANRIIASQGLLPQGARDNGARAVTTSPNHRERQQIAAAVRVAAAKAESARGLIMKIRGTSITVTRRHTDFSATYEKRPGNPQLELTRKRVTAHEAMPEVFKFHAIAFQAAVYKARELGWIV
jgi:hypothetical protein